MKYIQHKNDLSPVLVPAIILTWLLLVIHILSKYCHNHWAWISSDSMGQKAICGEPIQDQRFTLVCTFPLHARLSNQISTQLSQPLSIVTHPLVQNRAANSSRWQQSVVPSLPPAWRRGSSTEKPSCSVRSYAALRGYWPAGINVCRVFEFRIRSRVCDSGGATELSVNSERHFHS